MEIEIKDIERFLSVSFKIQEETENDNNRQDAIEHNGLAFRGQPDKDYELLPSIGRNRKYACHSSILDQERNLIELSKYKLPNIFRSDLSPIDLLALLQHYGVPTRLLDVTSNPLVALYFASLNEDKDGEVIVFEYRDSDITNYPVFNAIAETYKFAFGTIASLSSFYENVINQAYFDEQRILLSSRDNTGGAKWIKKCCNDIIFIKATEQLERQKLQQGFYILFPNEIGEKEKDKDSLYFDKVIKPIDKDNKQIKKRFIIKKEAKADIRKKLNFLGISEATLFSDNIDIVCKNIVQQYKR